MTFLTKTPIVLCRSLLISFLSRKILLSFLKHSSFILSFSGFLSTFLTISTDFPLHVSTPSFSSFFYEDFIGPCLSLLFLYLLCRWVHLQTEVQLSFLWTVHRSVSDLCVPSVKTDIFSYFYTILWISSCWSWGGMSIFPGIFNIEDCILPVTFSLHNTSGIYSSLSICPLNYKLVNFHFDFWCASMYFSWTW